MHQTYVLLQPVVTEKTLAAQKLNRYTFMVAAGATKDQIKAAVEAAFKVNVTGIQTVTIKGTRRRTGRRRLPGESHTVKKAVVTVKQGQTIAVFETKGQS